MRTKRNWTFSKAAALAVVAASLSAGMAFAQEAVGKFTLPVPVAWGSGYLPAGEYRFMVNRAFLTSPSAGVITVRSNSDPASKIVLATFTTNQGGQEALAHSALTIVRHGQGGVVRSLFLKEIGATYFFPARTKMRLMASGAGTTQLAAAEPELLQRIPVEATGK